MEATATVHANAVEDTCNAGRNTCKCRYKHMQMQRLPNACRAEQFSEVCYALQQREMLWHRHRDWQSAKQLTTDPNVKETLKSLLRTGCSYISHACTTYFIDHCTIVPLLVPAKMVSAPSNSRHKTLPASSGMAKSFTGAVGFWMAQRATCPLLVPVRTTCLDWP